MGPYILDFYCAEEKLAIELDGNDHYTDVGYLRDVNRTKYLEGFGIRVIRFENKEVFRATETVLESIRNQFRKD